MRGGLARARAGGRRGPRVAAPPGLAVGRRGQLQRRGARAPAAVHHGLLAAAARRLPGTPPTAHTYTHSTVYMVRTCSYSFHRIEYLNLLIIRFN